MLPRDVDFASCSSLTKISVAQVCLCDRKAGTDLLYTARMASQQQKNLREIVF